MLRHSYIVSISHQNSWADIPPELVEEILGYCDVPSFIILGQVNRQLNSLALLRYFASQIEGDLIQLPFGFSENGFGRQGRRGRMRVLRTAFWLPSTIQHIDYCLGLRANYNRYINDLRTLTTFISRMPKLISICIDSGKLLGVRTVNIQSHFEVWNKLLATAISKGCKVLKVKDHILMGYCGPLLCSPKSPRGLHGPSFWRRLFHNPGQAPALQHLIKALGPPSNHQFARIAEPSLQEVHLDGNDSKYSFTVFHTILLQHSTSITQLSLIDLRIPKLDSKPLKNMFDHVHFALLESFSFSSHRPISPAIFLRFLQHHPLLINLSLNANFRKYKNETFPGWHPPKFPDLRTLRMFPEVLPLLVPAFINVQNSAWLSWRAITSLPKKLQDIGKSRVQSALS